MTNTETATETSATEYVAHTASIVAAFVSKNTLAKDELPSLISAVHGALNGLSANAPEQARSRPEPKIPIRKSVTPEYLICLESGRQFKSLRRHLRTQYGMTPEQYREKWGLPLDY